MRVSGVNGCKSNMKVHTKGYTQIADKHGTEREREREIDSHKRRECVCV